MLNFGRDVDGFRVNKTTQEICNSQNRNETNMTTNLVSNKTNKKAILYQSKHDVHKFISENTMC